ncbi:MAG: hypothetical protein ACK5NF_00605 [Bacilli bacterium]
MARIKIMQDHEVDSDTLEILESYKNKTGINHTVYRVMANKPELLKAFMNYTSTIRITSTLENGLEELLMYFVANINKCDY